jgi:Saxitoxin biosynthesis operon protein SxtJ
MNTHEELTRKHAVRGSSDRAFGLVFSVFFAFVGLSPLWKHRPIRPWALVLAGLFLAVGILRPVWLHPLNQGWIKLGLLLGRIVNPIVMGLLFFGVVAPTALIFRLLGKDPLRLSLSPTVPSYWIERRPPGPPPQTMSNQF